MCRMLGMLALLAMLVGCAAPEALIILQSKTQGIPPGQTVALAVEVDVPEPLPVHHEVVTRLRERLFTRLVSDGIFKAVVLTPAPAEYQMHVTVRGGREVSTHARIWLGSMIGPNAATARVELYEQATQRRIVAFEAQGTSESLPHSSKASLDTAVSEVVRKIIRGLRE